MNELKEPAMRTMEAGEAKSQFEQLLDDVACRRARVVVEKDGAPAAVLVSIRDLEDLHFLAKKRRWARSVLEEGWEAFKDVDPATIDEEVAAAVAAARAELREEHRRNPGPS